jgi:hypothetical protein
MTGTGWTYLGWSYRKGVIARVTLSRTWRRPVTTRNSRTQPTVLPERLLAVATSYAAVAVVTLTACGTDAVAPEGDAEEQRQSPTAPAATPTESRQTESETTSSTPSAEMPAGSIPQVLVGAWCGGSDSSAHDTWVFAPDGSFTADEQVRNGDTLILHTNEIGVHQRAIAMDEDTIIGDVLYLDGYSYVRGEC